MPLDSAPGNRVAALPGIVGVVRYPELEAATNAQRARLSAELGDPLDRIDWAKACLAPEVLDLVQLLDKYKVIERPELARESCPPSR